MPLQETSGNVTADAYGGGVAAVPNYIEDVFSTYLYTGNGSTQTITNGIDLAGKGGLTWIKARGANGQSHNLFDTARGATNYLITNSTGAQNSFGAITDNLTSFNANGFSLGANSQVNFNNDPFASWTFRKQPKFFDVVTYTGTGAAHTIAHNLGSTPGCIIVKRTDTTGNWQVYNVGNNGGTNPQNYTIQLNLTNAATAGASYWNNTAPTSTVFTVGTNADVNASGGTYVAYIFANNAGGFGLTGTDSVIACGTFWDGIDPSVTLGWEPQWVLVKNTSTAGQPWDLYDNMRGWTATSSAQALYANTSAAEVTSTPDVRLTATGFTPTGNWIGDHFLYIAIRRGPMKVPTDATKVFAPVVQASNRPTTVLAGFSVDTVFSRSDRTISNSSYAVSRLRGGLAHLATTSTAAEVSYASSQSFDVQDGYKILASGFTLNTIHWMMKRAPSFFDEVCYTGNSSGLTINHNLGVVPELIIRKRRDLLSFWNVFAAQDGFGYLNAIDAWGGTGNGSGTNVIWQATSTTVALTSDHAPAFAPTGSTNVIYLFASTAGVSKVGSYTGTGATQTISCGFTGGARFVMVKATSTTGNWVVVDTARGMVAGTDPYLNLNTTAAEVNANNIYTTTGGFQLVSADANTNANGTQYLYLAIAQT